LNNFQEKTNFIWSVADEVLRYDFKLVFNDYFDDVLNDMIDSNLDLIPKSMMTEILGIFSRRPSLIAITGV
jgi:hypothetical protein